MAQASTQICRLCNENNGVYYCYECKNVLCTICRERHDRVSTSSGHTITNTSTIDLADFMIDIDIQTLVNVPAEPSITQVQSFEKMLYKEIIEYMESKVDHSLCQTSDDHQKRIDEHNKENESLRVNIQRCKDHQNRIEMILRENEGFKEEFQRCTEEMEEKDDEHMNAKWTLDCQDRYGLFTTFDSFSFC
ncbi:unnamed protein product [Mytilus edulis]|uniref:B box-type domain-containing protein n=1 Tax=Mytilus edulis TaxID=6550 RepID=A0A8S3U366_MYTED|nr:unnamed protein product [Mytilus edulis]